jgi:hypothetical protein
MAAHATKVKQPNTINPSHQAPIHRGSFGDISTSSMKAIIATNERLCIKNIVKDKSPTTDQIQLTRMQKAKGKI